MRRAKRLSLLKDPRKNTKLWWIVKQKVYGGSLNYRKVRRPFDSKMLVHAVLKGRVGKSLWFTRREAQVRQIISRAALRYGIRLRDIAIAPDHIHILFYTRLPESQRRFLRLISAEMGRRYAAVQRSMGVRRPAGLWAHRPFTRMVSWGRKSLVHVKRYFKRNRLEALGFVEFKPRNHRLTQFLETWLPPSSA